MKTATNKKLEFQSRPYKQRIALIPMAVILPVAWIVMFVTTAEYYKARDVASIILQGRKNALDLPLWAFGPEAEKQIITYITSYPIQIIGIPNNGAKL